MKGDRTALPASVQQSRLAATETKQRELSDCHPMPGKALMTQRSPVAFWALRVIVALAAPLLLAVTAHAQDATDERRCTGQWRATNEERIASCTALIVSGRYQPANLAILHQDRGMALRARGDLAGAFEDFTAAVTLNPSYARAFAERGSVHLARHDLDTAIADLDAAIKLNGTDAGGVHDARQCFRREGGLRPRHRRLQRGNPAVPELRRRLLQSRPGIPPQGRPRPRDCRLRPGDQARSEKCLRAQ